MTRILYLAHRVPYPPDKGDRIRNFHVLRELSKSAEVWLACLADETVMEVTRQKLNEYCERVDIVPVSRRIRWFRSAKSALLGRSLTEGAFREPAFAALLRRWTNVTHFDAAIVSASGMAPYLRKELHGIPGFVDLVDVDSQKWFDFAESSKAPKRWLYRFEGHRVRKLEKEIATWAKAVTIVSPAECAVFDSFTHTGAGTVATNGVNLDEYKPQDVPNVPALAFVGAMDYLPNIDGAVWFAREIWPAVRAAQSNPLAPRAVFASPLAERADYSAHPECEFWIIGRRPTPEVRALANIPGVKLFADVPDVRPYLAKAAMAVCPIRIARGLQNKVLEAMAMAKPTLASPAAIAALSVEVGTHLLSPSSPEEWVKSIGEVLNSSEIRDRLGTAARQFVEEHHHWDRCLRPLIEAIVPGPVAVSA